MKKLLVGYFTVLSIFTIFIILLEFVIPHGGVVVESPVITYTSEETLTTDYMDASIDNANSTEEIIELAYTDTLPTILETAEVLGYYENDSILITIYQIRLYDSEIYVADVVAIDATSILSAFAYDTFGGKNKTQTVSDMAEDNDAIFAINSDYASHYDEGIVIRNGQILRSSISERDAVALWCDGTISTFEESDTSSEELLEDGAWQVWSFGPVLIENGESVASVNDGMDRDAAENPRTAFGLVSDNHFMFVCVDGRSDESEGVDIEELADIMVQLNCEEAYNFDGGGSSTMWFDGEVINGPSSGYERKVGDCVYILA